MWSLIAVAVNLRCQCLKTIQDDFMLTSSLCGFVVIRQSSKDQGAFSFMASPFSRSSASSLLGEDREAWTKADLWACSRSTDLIFTHISLNRIQTHVQGKHGEVLCPSKRREHGGGLWGLNTETCGKQS